MFKLNNLKAPANSHHAPKRKGRGIGSGLGKTAGRGHKGQEARSGGGRGPWFEGGQTSIQRRAPKVGFVSPLKNNQARISITELAAFAGQEPKLLDLVPLSQRKNSRVRVSIYGSKPPSAFPKSLEAHHFSPKAKELLEKAGVKLTVVEYKNGHLGVRRSKKVK